MNLGTCEPRQWSRRRWWMWVAGLFVVHVALIFALGERKAPTPRPPSSAPILRLAHESDVLLELNDPTLFALPHRLGFSGPSWLRQPDVKQPVFRWNEPPRWLALSPEKLGDTFSQFVKSNGVAEFKLDIKPAPEFLMPVVAQTELTAKPSTLRITGGLANRPLLNPPQLPSWAAADLLTNNVALVWVGADGRVITAILLCQPPGSGLEAADRRALEFAQQARFAPLPNRTAAPVLGELIFEWQTVAPPATNTPAAR